MSAPTLCLTIVILILATYTCTLNQALIYAEARTSKLEALLAETETKASNVNSAIAALGFVITTIAAYYVVNLKRAALSTAAKAKDLTIELENLQKEIKEARDELEFVKNAMTALQDGVGAGTEGGDEYEDEKDKEWRIIR
ncbi:hypothetical protein IQ06DRAFT_302174 [Phaeosphaeriaceae sp. SRC1lsM3a]|nr:hypothetical protein IQ06DRAFT_302174 [Stagonospora sp. SRC1lsM3a]